jgi:hypothetical protein
VFLFVFVNFLIMIGHVANITINFESYDLY